MSPSVMRFFTLVGIALACISMQTRARAQPSGPTAVQAVQVAIPVSAFHVDPT